MSHLSNRLEKAKQRGAKERAVDTLGATPEALLANIRQIRK